MKAEFPKMLYHRTENPRIVNDPSELEALGPDWKESPAEFDMHRETEESFKRRTEQAQGLAKPAADEDADEAVEAAPKSRKK